MTDQMERNRRDLDRTRSFIKHAKEAREERSSFAKVLIGMIIVFIGIILSIFVLADNENFLEEHFGENSFITKLFEKLSVSNDNKEHADFALPFGLRRQNILFLGVDASNNPNDLWTGTRTDTIILVNIDPKTKSVNALSIPRDSKVYLPGDNGVNKINAAHAIGGIEMTKRTIEDTLGVHIDRYIMVHDSAVKEIVDAMDGLDIYVEKPMHYNDYSGNLHINFSKGDHHLDGQQAVEYLRFRHDALGDIGRTQRQQWLLRSLLNKLKQPATITKIPDIISVAKKYVKTDMSFYEMSQYAALAKHIDMDKIEIAMLPGAPNQKGYISYWILDPEKTQEVVNRVIYRDKEQFDEAVPMTAAVLASETSRGEQMAENLKTAGIDVKCTGRATRAHSQFIAHSSKVTNDYYNWLKKKNEEFGGLQFVYDPVNYYCGETDFTIILSGN
ncbi:cell envelope-related transcriptional attenuator [Fusobacterium sp. CAG:439]|nr:cell envelope-related transcriptional attenuator [Fusobacterium sp. CAG:439]